ncbi:MAG TPA: DUF1858 domain-containing protein [Thalassobaculum sp.]
MKPEDLLSMTLADVMERWPQTVPVFNRRRMACPGCVMARFMTLAEAARSYSVAGDDLADDLLGVITRPEPATAMRS